MNRKPLRPVRLSLLAAWFAVMLSGCGHFEQQSFYQPSIAAADRAGLKDYDEDVSTVRIDPVGGITIRLRATGGIRQYPRFDMNVLLDEGTTMRWRSNEAVLSDDQGRALVRYFLGKPSFTNFCTPEQVCSLADINLVEGPVEIVKFGWGKGKANSISTDPTNTIHGARTALLRFEFAIERRLDIRVPLSADNEAGAGVRQSFLTLPAMEANGQVHGIPPIQILQDTRKVYEPLLLN